MINYPFHKLIFYLKHLSVLLKINILSPTIILEGTQLLYSKNNFLMNFVQIPGPQVHDTIQESYTFQVFVFMYSVWAACDQMKLTGKCTITSWDITV